MAIIKGTGAAEHLNGTTYGDAISAYAGNDTIGAGDGYDSVYAGDGSDWVDGGTGDDRLYGEAGNDTLLGGKGNDWLSGGTGADSMRGDAGNDVYVVDHAGDVVLEGVFGGTDEVQTSLASLALGAQIEHLTYTGIGDFTGAGNDLANVLKGTNAGRNALSGGGGNDLLHLQNGSGHGWGDTGDDTILSGNGSAALGGGDGDDSLDGGGGNDSLAGGAGQDTLVGGAGDDQLGHAISVSDGWGKPIVYTMSTSFAAAANDGAADELRGMEGDDILWGQAGDRLYGGIGDDTYHVGDGGAFLSEEGGGGTDTVVVHGFRHALAADIEDLTFDYAVAGGFPSPFPGSGGTPSGADGTGNALDNAVKGGELRDTLQGLGGNDFLDGGDGVDLMRGGEGNDTIVAGASYGRADGEHAHGDAGDDELHSYGGAHLFGGAGEDQLIAHSTIRSQTSSPVDGTTVFWSSSQLFGEDGADTLTGGMGRDSLDGGQGTDQLLGGEGDDLLVGGMGQDVLGGGLGADLFRFAAAAESGRGVLQRDAILDFERGVDALDLTLIDANATLAGDQAFMLANKATAFAVWQGVQADGTLLVSADVSGDAVADLQLSIGFGDGLVAGRLVAGDFLL